MNTIRTEPLTAAAFAPFGQVIEIAGAQHYPINNGMTERYHDLARVELGGVHPRPLISIFRGQPYDLPLTLLLATRSAARPSTRSRQIHGWSSSLKTMAASPLASAPSSPSRVRASISR
jgi:ureidoglycolate hydrolase